MLSDIICKGRGKEDKAKGEDWQSLIPGICLCINSKGTRLLYPCIRQGLTSETSPVALSGPAEGNSQGKGAIVCCYGQCFQQLGAEDMGYGQCLLHTVTANSDQLKAAA